MAETKQRLILDAAYQPQVRTNTDTKRIMLDVLIALMPAAAVAVSQFGAYTLAVMASSVLSAVFFEWLYRRLMGKSCTIGDLSAAVTGLSSPVGKYPALRASIDGSSLYGYIKIISVFDKLSSAFATKKNDFFCGKHKIPW